MLHDFGDFLQHGGAAHYVVTRHKGRVCGYRAGISTKTTFPNYNALRADFAANLNETIAENTRMLLVALTPADSVPVVTQADLRDVTDAKVEALRQWDRRLESIFSDYQTHPERIRSLRVNMEERLLLAFAGLINELRQEDLGIQRYVWRSRDDAKVRVRHAEHDNRVFRWDEPPEDGHPGQAYNCRCVAEPILPVAQNDLVLADFVSPTSSFLVELGSRATALTTLGAAALAALAASEELQEFTRFATQNRIERAAEILGVDLGSAEGLFAVLAHELVYEAVIIGSVASLPKTTDAARIAAQAAALFEMANPGTILKVSEGDLSAQIALGAFVEEAYAMFEAGRLRLLAGTLAEGWVEVFPELTDNERRLGQLPGFTPERIQN